MNLKPIDLIIAITLAISLFMAAQRAQLVPSGGVVTDTVEIQALEQFETPEAQEGCGRSYNGQYWLPVECGPGEAMDPILTDAPRATPTVTPTEELPAYPAPETDEEEMD